MTFCPVRLRADAQLDSHRWTVEYQLPARNACAGPDRRGGGGGKAIDATCKESCSWYDLEVLGAVTVVVALCSLDDGDTVDHDRPGIYAPRPV